MLKQLEHRRHDLSAIEGDISAAKIERREAEVEAAKARKALGEVQAGSEELNRDQIRLQRQKQKAARELEAMQQRQKKMREQGAKNDGIGSNLDPAVEKAKADASIKKFFFNECGTIRVQRHLCFCPC